MNISKEKVVSINYKLTNEEGQVLDSSEGKEPLNYIQGMNAIIPGLEKALEGKTTGDNLKVTVQPEEAYGNRDENNVLYIERSKFGDIKDIEVGQQFQMQSQNGPVIIRVVEVQDDKVKIDANHELAGKVLNFDVEVMNVRDASQEEIEHGHVHGPGGHQH